MSLLLHIAVIEEDRVIHSNGELQNCNERHRYEGLGMEDIFLGASVKIQIYEQFLQKYGLKDEEVMFMGDDIPDLEVMRRVGCPVCPADACPEVKSVSCYVSQQKGGQGCGRDVIEQTLKAQDRWLSDERAFGW